MPLYLPASQPPSLPASQLHTSQPFNLPTDQHHGKRSKIPLPHLFLYRFRL